MGNSMKRLYLFPYFYPYSTFRECFLEDEIKYLAQEFDEIYLVPYFYDEPVRDYPKNCKITPSDVSYPEKRRLSFNRKTFVPFLKDLFKPEEDEETIISISSLELRSKL